MSIPSFSRIQDYLDNQQRGIILRRFAGLAVSVLTLLVFVGCVSYLFTWKQDQSLLAGADEAIAAANTGGKWGHSLSSLLISGWFGLGAFAVVFALVVLSLRLLFGKRKFSIIRTIVLALTGAFLSSLVLAYLSILTNTETLLCNGLGGACGAQAVHWLTGKCGSIVTLFTLIVLCIGWTFFVSRKFSRWFTFTGEHVESKEEIEDKGNVDVEEATVTNQEEPVEGGNDDGDDGGPEVPDEGDPQDRPDSGKDGTKPDEGDKPDNGEITVVEGGGLSTEVDKELPRIDVREELENFKFPTLDILKDYSEGIHKVSNEELKRNNFKIRTTLETYNIGVENVTAVVGPTVTLYKIYPAKGVKISGIQNLHKEIGLSLNTKGLRITMLPDSVGIEVPNATSSIVPLKALLNSDEFRNSKAELPIAIGYTITQKVKVFDLADAPHLLVAGATKQGKSVGLNVLIASLLYSKHPSELKFVFIDPKTVEFSAYRKLLHHYLAVLPTAASDTDEMASAIVKKAPAAEAVLKSLCVEMDARYDLLDKAGVNDVILYNNKYRDRHLLPTEGHRYMPYIVTVIDEYSDLTMSAAGTGGESRKMAQSITNSIIRLAQKGRACGIHIVIATQRPSVDIVTGTIKANFPTRIAFRVISRENSQTILGEPGAEKLIGRGDMLYYAGVEIERVQCALIGNDEITRLTDFIGSQTGYKKSYNTPYYLPLPDEVGGEDGGNVDTSALDENFVDAARTVVSTQRGSTSDLQRKLGTGYARAGRIMDQLEKAGIVGHQDGSKPRQVLISDLDELDLKFKELGING